MTPQAHSVSDIARSLMAIDSTTGSEAGVVDATASLLEQLGWPVLRVPVSSGRDCLLARSSEDPDVTLSTHLDTVPPYIPPAINGDRLSGRGACDAKGIAASMIVAAGRLREQQVPVALLFVVGEETTHHSAYPELGDSAITRLVELLAE